jgi:hypothetical protein
MNFKKACENLDIEYTSNISIEDLKRQYRAKALLYHPDKNHSPDAVSKFQEIHESYDYLLKYKGYMEPDIDNNSAETEYEKGTYRWILFSFLKNILKTETHENLVYTIIKRVITTCEVNSLETLEKLDKTMLIRIYEILKRYLYSFHFTQNFIEKIETIITEKTKNDECIILNPTLDDLFENNLYRLKVNNHTYIIPLWHNELVYDNSGNDIYIKCNPILPENIDIDEKNNLLVNVEFKISDIWDRDIIEIPVGKQTFTINPSLLRLQPIQKFIFAKQGISKINYENIYDISKKNYEHYFDKIKSPY